MDWQVSVAVHVRWNVIGQEPTRTPSVKVAGLKVQASVTPGVPVTDGADEVSHSTVASAGKEENTGGVVSLIVKL
jgi:hypothetical protein